MSGGTTFRILYDLLLHQEVDRRYRRWEVKQSRIPGKSFVWVPWRLSSRRKSASPPTNRSDRCLPVISFGSAKGSAERAEANGMPDLGSRHLFVRSNYQLKDLDGYS